MQQKEWFEMVGTFKGHLVQAPCNGQGYFQLDQGPLGIQTSLFINESFLFGVMLFCCSIF